MSGEVVVREADRARTQDEGFEWDLAAQWARGWRLLKWVFTAVSLLGLLVVVGQGFLFYRIFADIHPGLGWAFVAVLASLLGLLVGRPLLAFFRTPVMARPPATPADPARPTRRELTARVRYDISYLKALQSNRELAEEHGAIPADLEAGRALLARITGDGGATASSRAGLVREIERFEAARIEARLSRLDARIDRIIHAEAVSVGVATAVSMNGTVDAFIVLWRNANLVSRIARLYFGRPNLRGSLIILRDVAAIVVMSRALEDVTDITGEVIGGLLGRMGGLVAGPVMDGGINAMMTLKLGHLAKRRCRSFEAWTPEKAPSISADALERVKRESGSVATELLKRCSGLTRSAARATEGVMSGSKSAWSVVGSWFGAAPA